jgi:hypothetical protein
MEIYQMAGWSRRKQTSKWERESAFILCTSLAGLQPRYYAGDRCHPLRPDIRPDSSPKAAVPISLLGLIKTSEKPSLTRRTTLTHTITQSLMYLHSVN